MPEQNLLDRALEQGGLAVAVVCLTIVALKLINLNANHLAHWTAEMEKTRAVYDQLMTAFQTLQSWCQQVHGRHLGD